MIPLRSSERTYSTATVTLTLIVINLLVFFYELSLSGWRLNYFIASYGIVPDRYNIFSLLTSMFIHVGFAHILVCYPVFQRRGFCRLFAGFERRRGMVRAHRRLPGRHGAGYADAHPRALPPMAIKCSRK